MVEKQGGTTATVSLGVGANDEEARCAESYHCGYLGKQQNTTKGVLLPVLKINNHATGNWRTKDILG